MSRTPEQCCTLLHQNRQLSYPLTVTPEVFQPCATERRPWTGPRTPGSHLLAGLGTPLCLCLDFCPETLIQTGDEWMRVIHMLHLVKVKNDFKQQKKMSTKKAWHYFFFFLIPFFGDWMRQGCHQTRFFLLVLLTEKMHLCLWHPLCALLRGKCNVTLLNETDVLAGYLEKEVNMPSVYLSHYFDT